MTENVYYVLLGEEAKWYDEGMIAFDQGQDYYSCPYADGTIEKSYWQTGYAEAKNDPIVEQIGV